jgi:hypothetical protein
MRRFSWLAVVLLLLAPGLIAQARTVAVLDFLPLTPGANPALAPLFSDSIALELGRAGYRVVDKATVRAAQAQWSDPRQSQLKRADVLALAKSLGADAVVAGYYGVEGKVLTAGTRAYDVLSGRLALASVEEGESGLAVFSTIDAIAAAVAAKVRERLPDLSPTEVVVRKEEITVETVVVETFVEKGQRGAITVTSDLEGAEVWSGQRLLGTTHGGRLEVQAKVGATLALVERMPGWYEATTVLSDPQEGQSYALNPLYRQGSWEASAAFLPQVPFGLLAGGSWHLIPDTLTIEADLGAWALTGEFPPTATTRAFGFYRSDLEVLYRFFPVNSPLRAGLGIGAFGHAFQPGQAFLWALGLGPVVQLEYNAPRWRLFVNVKAEIPYDLRNYYPVNVLGSYVSGGASWKF